VSDILRQARLVSREIFDPTNQEHMESFKTFLRTGNWGEVQFWPELPYIEVPMTVMMKYVLHTLQLKPETAAERATRIAAKPNLVTNAAVPAVPLERSNELIRQLIEEQAA
jgi:hypothetical protein